MQKIPQSYTHRNREPKTQLELFPALAEAPAKVRDHGLRAAHPRPLVSMGKAWDGRVRSWRAPARAAWRFPSLQYAVLGSSIAALALDCDDPDRLAAGLAELLAPNWIVRRRDNDHAHAVWTLAKPVHKYPTARPGPLLFLAEIGDYYAQTSGADPAYSGLLAHNPTRHFREEEFSVTWGHREPRTLEQLASVIPFGWERPEVRQTGIGRNADIFAAGMSWAGRQANVHLPVLPALMSIMEEVLEAHPAADHAYTVAEVQASARMIEKYRERWAANGWHKPAWIERQKARSAKQTGQARKRSASPEGSNEVLKPWEMEGISRRTWYRRRAARKGGTVPNTDKHPGFAVSDKKSAGSDVRKVAEKIPARSLAEIAAHAKANVEVCEVPQVPGTQAKSESGAPQVTVSTR
ncbi:MAG: replication initiation protein [Defluviicoccus sp.]|nr:replication initiation protein [Defluviicoccus sp.]